MHTLNSNPVYSAIMSFLNRPQLAGRPLLLGYSGGLDSQVLLHALSTLQEQGKINARLRCIHINHGLSENAHSWQSFTQQQCQSLAVPYRAVQVDLQQHFGGGTEEKARNARYQAFAEHLDPQEVILTAHHLDDQAESLLLALKRGAGVLGLSAMQELREMPNVGLIGRPLLHISRSQLEQYARQYQLSWVEDESNLDCKYDRNFLRQRVLPIIRERWPNFSASLSKSAQIQQQTQQLLEEVAQADLQHASSGEAIELDRFLSLSQNRQLNALRHRFKQLQIRMPEQKQLLQALKQMRTAATDKNPQVKCSTAVLRRYQGRLYITPDYQDIQNWSTNIELKPGDIQRIELPDGLGEVCLEVCNDVPELLVEQAHNLASASQYIEVSKEARLTLACHHNNPTCKPQDRDHSRPLKKILQERGIPPWLRGRQIYLSVDNHFAALAGHFVCQDFTLATDLAHNKRIIKITLNLIQK